MLSDTHRSALLRRGLSLEYLTLGLVPMLFATGPGSEIQEPLAAVVIGGLIRSALLTLFILPTLYKVFERSAGKIRHPFPEPLSTKELELA